MFTYYTPENVIDELCELNENAEFINRVRGFLAENPVWFRIKYKDFIALLENEGEKTIDDISRFSQYLKFHIPPLDIVPDDSFDVWLYTSNVENGPFKKHSGLSFLENINETLKALLREDNSAEHVIIITKTGIILSRYRLIVKKD